MGFWSNLFGSGEATTPDSPQATLSAAPLTPMSALTSVAPNAGMPLPITVQPPPGAGMPFTITDLHVNPPAPNDSMYDIVGAANQTLAAVLSKLPVKWLAPPQSTTYLPIESVSLNGPAPYLTGVPSIHEADAHAKVTLHIKLKPGHFIGNYDSDSVNNAIHAMIASVPALVGHVKFAKDIAVEKIDHATIWQQLQPILTQSGKFAADEIVQLSEYFKKTAQTPAESNTYGAMWAEHDDDKMKLLFCANPLESDKPTGRSCEEAAIDYFNEPKTKELILKSIRKKIGDLHNEKISATDLENLDFHAAVMKGPHRTVPTIVFGSKAMGESTELGKTSVTKIDTDVFTPLFMQAFIEATPDKKLPSIFARVSDPWLIAQAIRSRMEETPELKAALDHTMFKTQVQAKAESEVANKLNLTKLPNAHEGMDAQSLDLAFFLPHNIDLGDLRLSTAQSAEQMKLVAQKTLSEQALGGRAA